MTEKAFVDFVQKNIVVLDELMARYSVYRAEIIQSFWDDLGRNIGKNVPNSWKLLKEIGAGEHVCGWSCDRQILGTQRSVQIAFGFVQFSSSLSESRWPIMNCWTGISLGLPASSRDQMLKAAGQLSIRTERRERELDPLGILGTVE